jgi:gluconolactonase
MRISSTLAATLLISLVALAATAQEKPGKTFTIGDGKLTLTAPANWTEKKPAINFIEAEYSIPPVQGDENPGRLTAMGAGGSVEDNVKRWADQFAGEGGAAKPKVDKLTVSGAEIQLVDLAGTYKDSPGGPFAGGKTVMRNNYRMLGAIIQTKDKGNYFLKLYGPKATIDENEKGFQEMVKSLKVK